MTASLHLPIPFPSAGRFAVAEFDEASLPPDLIRAAQSGDESAFHSIIRACKGRLAAMASRYVQSASELDDLCQDIFVHLWRGLHSYRFDAPFPHWVSRVAVNTCLTHLKRRKRRTSFLVPLDEPEALERLPDPTDAHEAAGRDAAAVVAITGFWSAPALADVMDDEWLATQAAEETPDEPLAADLPESDPPF